MGKGAAPKKKPSKAAKKRAKDRATKHVKFLTKHNMLSFARTHEDCDKTGGGKQCMQYGDKLGAKPSPQMDRSYEAAVHHVLPVAAVVGFTKEFTGTKLNNIASCYGKVDWCINTKPNLMWLPYFSAYQRHRYNRTLSNAPDSLAAHDFDHNPSYNDDVKDVLRDLWQQMAGRTSEKAKCEKAKEVVDRLNTSLPTFKSDLEGRPTGKILSDAAKDPPLIKASWWKDFSMSKGKAKKKPDSKLRARPPKRSVQAAIKRNIESRS